MVSHTLPAGKGTTRVLMSGLIHILNGVSHPRHINIKADTSCLSIVRRLRSAAENVARAYPLLRPQYSLHWYTSGTVRVVSLSNKAQEIAGMVITNHLVKSRPTITNDISSK